ncbi:hypothetical protein [Herbaspirillum sp. SJZ107]|uniref:hypothetical protein n=1 Tax=Herbaspirillum sp. SJZ107 TaxID=2572881 RepID=UPI00114FD767|nr:hypothetical protein [Herbaspirillum sp. SJZ107]TQK03490.1 hypothetical protein FBX97_5060 [Herbaspirillum sp. SJZ107]
MTTGTLNWLSRTEDEDNFISARTLYREASKHDQRQAAPHLLVMLKVEEKLQTVRGLIAQIIRDWVTIPPPTSAQEEKATELFDALDRVLRDNEQVEGAQRILADPGKLVTSGLSK